MYGGHNGKLWLLGVGCTSRAHTQYKVRAAHTKMTGQADNEHLDISFAIPYLAHQEKSLMSMHFYSCRHLLGLQVQRFVEQQQVSLKWITQGLSSSGRLKVKAIPLKQPCNYDTKSLFCPQHTQYTCQMYRCTSSAKR
jgi:hypothetical protein